MIQPARKAKIKWQCRRGMLELDLILCKFIENHVEQLNEAQLQVFENLLGTSDPVLYSWLIGSNDSPDKDMQSIIDLIKAS